MRQRAFDELRRFLAVHEAAEGIVTHPTAKSLDEGIVQNRQSEFLAVGSMAVLAIYLRQRGSPESKPVGASHDSTGIER